MGYEIQINDRINAETLKYLIPENLCVSYDGVNGRTGNTELRTFVDLDKQNGDLILKKQFGKNKGTITGVEPKVFGRLSGCDEIVEYILHQTVKNEIDKRLRKGDTLFDRTKFSSD
jgi:hypothetical protein